MALDLNIYNENGEFEFNPSAPFVFGKDVIANKYRLILENNVKDVLKGKNNTEEKINNEMRKAISKTNMEMRKIKGFENSSLKKLDINKEKGYIGFVVDVVIDGEKMEVSVV